MKRVLALAVLLSLGMAGMAWADSMPLSVDSTTKTPWTKVVFNDSGGQLVHGQVVVWDNDDTEHDRSGYPYVTTTTSADFIHTAGVMLTPTCPDQTLCEIVVKGWAVADAPSTLTEDTVVSTSTTAGRIGDATAGNNVCYLGVLLEDYDIPNAVACSDFTSGHCGVPIEVNIQCVP